LNEVHIEPTIPIVVKDSDSPARGLREMMKWLDAIVECEPDSGRGGIITERGGHTGVFGPGR
jgi:hypothetical protein